MDLQHLRHFIAVAEELNFSRAAERLHMAQPPLSQSIKRLEESLGIELFSRTRRKVELTGAGKVFLGEAQRILMQIERSILAARRAASGDGGRLNLGFVTPALFGVIPAVIREFGTTSPNVETRYEEHSTSTQIERLLSGQLDLGFVIEQTRLPQELECQRILRLEEGIAVPSGWPLARQREVRLGDLADLPFIMFPREIHPDLYDAFFTACRTAGFEPKVAHVAIQTTTFLSLVSAELGVCLINRSIEEIGFKEVTLLPLVDKLNKAPSFITAAWVPPVHSSALSRLIACIRSIAKA